MVLVVLAVATTVVYALYTRDDRTVHFFGTRDLQVTVPFCLVGIARFGWLALIRPRASSPTEAMLRDWPFLVNLAAWGVVVVFIIYGAR